MESISYRIVDCGKKLRRAFDQRVGDVGLTGPQGRLMMVVKRDPGRPQSVYADVLEVEPITLTRMIDRLEDAGMVERHPDPEDRRAKLVQLTKDGAARVAEMQMIVDAFNEEMMSGFSAAEREALKQAITLLGDRLTAMCQQPAEADHG